MVQRVRVVLCFLFSIFSCATLAQTSPTGAISPGFQACEDPIKLVDFYHIRATGWQIADISIEGHLMVGVARYGNYPNQSYAVWVQDLGPDKYLEASDFNLDTQMYYIGTFPVRPFVKISKTGILAFYMSDIGTLNRSFPDPNYVPSPGGPPQGTIDVPPDSVLFTCYFLACSVTYREHLRFMPTYHIAYTSPPNVNFMADGALTGFVWQEMPWGSTELVISYARYQNTVTWPNSWAPTTSAPPPVSPYIAIERIEPFSGAVATYRKEILTGPYDGSGLWIPPTMTSTPGMTWEGNFLTNYTLGSSTLSGGVFNSEFSLAEPNTGPGASTTPYLFNIVSLWTEDPSVPGFTYWNAPHYLTTSGRSITSANGDETLIVRTKRESVGGSYFPRDVVFQSSINGYAGPDIPVSPVDDQRTVNRVFSLNHSMPGLPTGETSMMIAIETTPGYNSIQNKTQLYQYQASHITGQIGSFVPYKEVPVQGNGAQRFYMYGAGGDYVWGRLDQINGTPPTQDYAISRCP